MYGALTYNQNFPKKMQMRQIGITAVVLLVLIPGCRDGSEKIPPTYPVTVTVTQDGKPFVGISVFLDGAPGAEWITTGTTNADGQAACVTKYLSFERRGAPEGDFSVRIGQKAAAMPGELTDEEYSKLSEPAKAAYLKKITEFQSNNLLIPEKLASTSGTPLKLQVRKTGENRLDVELSDYR